MSLSQPHPAQAHLVAEWKHDRPMNGCRFDPSGRYVFGASQDAVVTRFRMGDGQRTVMTGGHQGWTRALAFGGGGEFVISGGTDRNIVWWDAAAESPTPLRTIEAHAGWVRSMDNSPGGALIATGGNDNMVRIWDGIDGSLKHELSGHEGHIYTVRFHPDGTTLLSGDLMGMIKQWEISSGKEVRSFDAKQLHSYNGGQGVDYGGVRSLAVSSDGKYLAAGGLHEATNPFAGVNKALVLLFDWTSQEISQQFVTENVERGIIWRLRWLRDGSLMGACSAESHGMLLFWKPEAPGDFHHFKLTGNVRDMDLHPDGVHVATAHYDSHIRLTKLAAKS